MSRTGKKLKDHAKNLLQLCDIFGPDICESLESKSRHISIGYNKKIEKFAQKMKATAAAHKVAYLTGNQVTSIDRIFVLHKNLQDDKLQHSEYKQSSDYEAYINPKITTHEGSPSEIIERCNAIPFFLFRTNRYHNVTLTYKNSLREERTENALGFRAHLIQHCMDHLNGQLLLDYQISQGKFEIDTDMKPYFQRSIFLIKEYTMRLKMWDERFKKQEVKEDDVKYIEMKSDYLKRLKTQYGKEAKQLQDKMDKFKFPSQY